MLRGDDSFRFLEGFNAYKVDLQDKYNINAIFKVFFYLSLFNVSDDSRLSPFDERRNMILDTTSKNPLGVSIESILKHKIKWI